MKGPDLRALRGFRRKTYDGEPLGATPGGSDVNGPVGAPLEGGPSGVFGAALKI